MSCDCLIQNDRCGACVNALRPLLYVVGWMIFYDKQPGRKFVYSVVCFVDRACVVVCPMHTRLLLSLSSSSSTVFVFVACCWSLKLENKKQRQQRFTPTFPCDAKVVGSRNRTYKRTVPHCHLNY